MEYYVHLWCRIFWYESFCVLWFEACTPPFSPLPPYAVQISKQNRHIIFPSRISCTAAVYFPILLLHCLDGDDVISHHNVSRKGPIAIKRVSLWKVGGGRGKREYEISEMIEIPYIL